MDDSNKKRKFEKGFVKIVVHAGIFALVFVLIASFLGLLFTYPTFVRLTMHELRNKSESIDMVFIGASRSYRGFSPEVFDEELGLTTFTAASSGQGVVDSYYILREVYRYHSPEVVVIDVSRNRLSTTNIMLKSEAIFDNYTWSFDKLRYLNDAFPPKRYLGAIFPGLRYESINPITKDRLYRAITTKLSADYWTYSSAQMASASELYAGRGFVYSYQIYDDSKMMKGWHEQGMWDDSIAHNEAVEYFRKMVELCRKNGSTPIFITLPSSMPQMGRFTNYDKYHEFVNELANDFNVPFFDFGLVRHSVFERTNAFFKDASHLNGPGATEFSRVASQVISQYLEGILDYNRYFYSSYKELLDDSPFVLGTWVDPTDGGFLADAYVGTGIELEFEFWYKKLDEDEFVMFRSYSTDSFTEYPPIEDTEYRLRVNARTKGTDVDFEQFYVLEVTPRKLESSGGFDDFADE